MRTDAARRERTHPLTQTPHPGASLIQLMHVPWPANKGRQQYNAAPKQASVVVVTHVSWRQ